MILTRYTLELIISSLILGLSISQSDTIHQYTYSENFLDATKNKYRDNPCSPVVKDCLLCDDKNECTRCVDGLFLDITTLPFKCDSCPTQCRGCNLEGCQACSPGYYRKFITYFERQSYICDKCSGNCLTCETQSNQCQTCPDYYLVDKDTK